MLIVNGICGKCFYGISRSLSGLGKNLKSFGITYTIKNIGPNKEIRIENDGSVISNTSEAEKAGKLAYEKEAAYIASEETEE